MIYDLENNRLVENWPEPVQNDYYTGNYFARHAYNDALSVYNNRPFVKCSEETPKLWAGRNGEEIPEGEYKLSWQVKSAGEWLDVKPIDGVSIFEQIHGEEKRQLAYPVTKEAGAAPGSKAYYFENAILAFGVDAAIEYFATAEDKQQEIREHLSGLSPQPAQPAGQGENDDAAILAAKKLGILSGAPLNYFIQGYNASQPASQQPSQQPSGEGLEESRAVDDDRWLEWRTHPEWDNVYEQLKMEGYSTGSEEDVDNLYAELKRRLLAISQPPAKELEDGFYSYEETGAGKKWDDMTEIERVKYESNKMRSALLIRRNHIRHLQKTRDALQSQLSSKPVDHYGEGLIELGKEIVRLREEKESWRQTAKQAEDGLHKSLSQLSLLQSREGGFAEWAQEEGWAFNNTGKFWYHVSATSSKDNKATADLFTQFLNETGAGEKGGEAL